MIKFNDSGSPAGYTGRLVGAYNTIDDNYLVFLEERSGHYFAYKHDTNIGENDFGTHFFLQINAGKNGDRIKYIRSVEYYLKEKGESYEFTPEELAVMHTDDDDMTDSELANLDIEGDLR
jgi:hypothetical protein